jgi:hypothetical protein
MPNQWETFSLNINNNYKISKIISQKNTPFGKDKSESTLFGFFTEIIESNISKFNNGKERGQVILSLLIKSQRPSIRNMNRISKRAHGQMTTT